MWDNFSVSEILASIVGGLIILYIAARLASAAYFRSKRQFQIQQEEKDGASKS
jgi:L-lactate permease